MTFTHIHIDRKAEAGFRRRALKAYGPPDAPDGERKEYLETLWGAIRGEDLFVHAFMPIAHRGRPGVLHYEEDDLDDQEEQALEESMVLLGSIHSHPDCIDAIFSEGDTRDTQETQEAVVGICAIVKKEGEKKRSCTIQYWPAPRPMKVVYGVRRKKK